MFMPMAHGSDIATTNILIYPTTTATGGFSVISRSTETPGEFIATKLGRYFTWKERTLVPYFAEFQWGRWFDCA
jgi:hypothetical protein